MITRWDAELIAAPWLHRHARPGVTPGITVEEFEYCYVLWGTPPPGETVVEGTGRAVVDRDNGDLTYWPQFPPTTIAAHYRDLRRDTPAPPLTWDPLVQARRDRLRAPYPARITHVQLADGRVRTARTMQGEGTPNLHPLVRETLDQLPPSERVRGGDRCSEVAALSDLCHVEDARRQGADEPGLTVEQVRDELLHRSELTTFLVREPEDPSGGRSTPPCLSCQGLLRRFGFAPPPVPGEPG